MARRVRPGAPEGRALRFEDLDPEGREAAKANWRQVGNIRSRLEGAVSAAQATLDNPANNPHYREKAGHRLSSLETIAPHLKDIPMTMEGATRERLKKVQAGAERSREEGRQTIRGAGWYFDHHRQIRDAAVATGTDVHRAIVATTALSPQNSPERERAAGAAIMDMVANQHRHTVHITRELRAAVNRTVGKGRALPASMVGQHVSLGQLDASHIAAIGSHNARLRDKGHPVRSTADFNSTGALVGGGANVEKAIRHLRGEISEEQTINPHSSPKVWSYKEATKASEPGTAQHGEYMIRMHQATGTEVPGQVAMDLYGLRGSHEGVLSPDQHTAEDTWMHSISTRQRPEIVEGSKGRGVSPAKFAATDKNLAGSDVVSKKPLGKEGPTLPPDPRVGGSAVTHAMNNAATRAAARRSTIDMGDTTVHMPAIGVQETAWTEQRIQAKKDPEYKEEQRAKAKPKAKLNPRQFPAMRLES